LGFVIEEERRVPVSYQADVVVAGGGVAGVAAAVAASRGGARVLLIERFGQLGGMATGGLVTVHLGYGRFELGLNREIGEAVLGCGAGFIETSDEWKWIDDLGFSSKKRIVYDAEDMKYLLEKMLLEAGVEILYHTYIVDTVVEDGAVTGVVLESKSGRCVAQGRVVVDATGDGDVFMRAGVEYNLEEHPWGVTLGHRFGGVDVEGALSFQKEHPEEYRALMDELEGIVGLRYRWRPSAREGITLCMGPGLHGFNVLDPRESTTLEVTGREVAMRVLEFHRKNVPGFEGAFVVEFAPQFGIRVTRRVAGEYVLSSEEVRGGARFDDVVVRSIYDVPYGVLLPKGVENLLVAGRCISTSKGMDELRLIAPCIATGEAAGVAAALAVERGVSPRDLDIGELQAALKGRTIP
jgi:ribulose 1,5-bisphosphate synthetase/thiazole synthase